MKNIQLKQNEKKYFQRLQNFFLSTDSDKEF